MALSWHIGNSRAIEDTHRYVRSMAIEALLFDFDGLLVDTEVAGYEAWRSIYEGFGASFDFDEWCEHVLAVGGHKDYAEHVDSFAGPQDWATLHEERRAFRNERCVALPGVCDLLANAAARGLRLGIVSNSPAEWVRERLNATPLAEAAFEVVITASTGCAPKPSPEGYEKALAALGLGPSQAIVFEDAPRGVTAARSAGVYCVAVPSPVTNRGDFSNASEVLDTLDGIDIEALIARAAALARRT